MGVLFEETFRINVKMDAMLSTLSLRLNKCYLRIVKSSRRRKIFFRVI